MRDRGRVGKGEEGREKREGRRGSVECRFLKIFVIDWKWLSMTAEIIEVLLRSLHTSKRILKTKLWNIKRRMNSM